jgi:hypothetical protein
MKKASTRGRDDEKTQSEKESRKKKYHQKIKKTLQNQQKI